VDIDFKEASLVPSELQRLFEANYDLLLSIFNPQVISPRRYHHTSLFQTPVSHPCRHVPLSHTPVRLSQGWLDITFLDDTHRVGRDDKGNIFYLERVSGASGSL